jgi:sigma-B regulation protein RsbU (phosphoserine phosphatase)
MDATLKILLVEDSETDADLLVRFLNREKINFKHSRVWNKDAFLSAINENDHDLIIADQSLPQFSGMEAFRISKNVKKNIPFILVTGTVTETILTEFAKEGIDDYILKENLLRLPSAIKQVLSKKKIEDLNKKLEIAHKDINDSINYAKKIQNAMLPDSTQLLNNYPESFILLKPKDILSGDFYWFKNEGNVFFTAVADCTGHGIPGALMSMIGIEKLNNVILNTQETSKILKQLNESIEIALCQSTCYEHSHDGMDIALCSIDKKNNILKFAGSKQTNLDYSPRTIRVRRN